MTFQDFRSLVALSFRDPHSAALALLAQGWPMSARWMALGAAVSVSALLASFAAMLFSTQGPDGSQIVMLSRQPMMLALMQFGAITFAAGLMAGVGQMFGGEGRFADALLLAVWIEVLLLIVQAAQLAVSLILPGPGGVLGIVTILLFLWFSIQFTKALHRFRSTALVALCLVVTVLLAGFVLSLIAASLGILPEMPQ